MNTNTARRLRSAFWINLVCVIVALTFQFFDEGFVSIVGVVIGVAIATPLALLEESAFDRRMRRLPFSVAVLAKSITYIGSLFLAFGSVGLVVGLMQGLTMSDFWTSMTEPVFALQMILGFILYVVIVFFRQLDRILGPGVLVSYLLGRYHRPHREARIFMFLDLRSSTTLAEDLGPEAYLEFVNEFFRDISGPVLDNGGEIYEYVGDEVILTWREDRGLRDARCLRVFFDIDLLIERKKQRYLDRFGVVPEYKASVHVGEVMTAEIGDLKRGLIFNGDVLNTGARIQGECGRLGQRLLTSGALFDRLTLPAELTAESMGDVTLRGKSEPLELVAIA